MKNMSVRIKENCYKIIWRFHSEGSQPRVLTGRTDPEAEAPILWPSHEKRNLPGKDPDVGKV